MKKTLIPFYMLMLMLICSCSKHITKVVYDYNHKTATYYKDTVVVTKHPVVKEGGKISVKVTNYNPLSIDITANQEEPIVFYQTNNNKTLQGFLSMDVTSSDVAPTQENNNSTEDGDAENGGIPKVIKPSTDPLIISLYNLFNHYKKIASIKDNYRQFVNAIVSLNNIIEQDKYIPELDSTCLCTDMASTSEEIKKYFIEKNHPSILVCASVLTCGNSLISGDEITYQKAAYFIELTTLLDELEALEAEVTKQKAKKFEKNSTEKGKTNAEKNFNDTINKYPTEIKSLYEKDAYIAKTKEQTKLLNALREDYLIKRSAEMDDAINKYKAIGYLEFRKNLGEFKAEETDVLAIALTCANSITTKSTKRIINIDVAKTLKIDYSTGVFVTPYLYDEDFDIVQSDSGKYTISKINGGKTSYGAIGFINFHPTHCTPNFSIGGSIGTGLMFNDAAKIVFSPTLSLFIGQYQRCVLHIGAGFAQLDRVHSKYKDDEIFTDATYKPELKKEITSSFLFALSWNISRK